MNYRHAFHAGNFADVFKHALLITLIEALKLKPRGLCYIDTHAGAGRYDLHADAAQKTGEYNEGVMRLLAQPRVPDALQPYVDEALDEIEYVIGGVEYLGAQWHLTVQV